MSLFEIDRPCRPFTSELTLIRCHHCVTAYHRIGYQCRTQILLAKVTYAGYFPKAGQDNVTHFFPLVSMIAPPDNQKRENVTKFLRENKDGVLTSRKKSLEKHVKKGTSIS